MNNRTGQLGDIHCIPRIRFSFEPPRSSWTIERLQLPLRLAYGCTFHGCVGLTMDKTVVDCRHPTFTHGQLYTALSRVRHRSHSCCLLEEGNVDKVVPNIVYKDLLK
jgi:hypothetical protein